MALRVSIGRSPIFRKCRVKLCINESGALTCGLKIYGQVCEVGLYERLATAKMTATLQVVAVLDCGAYMSKNKRNRAKRRPAGLRQRKTTSRSSFIREPRGTPKQPDPPVTTLHAVRLTTTGFAASTMH